MRTKPILGTWKNQAHCWSIHLAVTTNPSGTLVCRGIVSSLFAFCKDRSEVRRPFTSGQQPHYLLPICRLVWYWQVVRDGIGRPLAACRARLRCRSSSQIFQSAIQFWRGAPRPRMFALLSQQRTSSSARNRALPCAAGQSQVSQQAAHLTDCKLSFGTWCARIGGLRDRCS